MTNFSEAQIAELSKPLDPKNVKPAGNGVKGDYIEGWLAINEANRIFGFDGWSYTIQLIQDQLAQEGAQWQAAYTCICTLTVGDAVRQDVGFGSGFGKRVGDAVEGATKEAATDALKRALRTFGNVFGLALYDKSRANVQAPAPELIADGDRDLIATLAPAAGVTLQKILEGYKVESLVDLTAEQGAAVIKRLHLTINTKKEAA